MRGPGGLSLISASGTHPTGALAIVLLIGSAALLVGVCWHLHDLSGGHPIRQFFRDLRDLPEQLGWRR